jgi:hypothetical protein
MYDPAHTDEGPVIGPGAAPTVTSAVAVQPELSAYDIVEVPGLSAVTTPEPPIRATGTALELQAPPDTELVNVLVAPLQMLVGPAIGDGETLTTIGIVS